MKDRKEYYSKYMKEYRAKNPKHREYKKFYMLKWKFGITKEMFYDLANKQSGRCKICGELLDLWRSTHLDHNHTTGKIRGLLCRNCNSLLGYSKENIDILNKAIYYLNEQ
jgi:hypothetical protein